MRKAVFRQSQAALGLLFPFHCSVCERAIDEGFLCAPCAAQIEPLSDDGCRQCGRTLTPPQVYCFRCRAQSVVDGGGCFGVYKEGQPLAQLIQSLKYRGDRALVGLLGPWMLHGAQHLALPDAITFVPMSRSRKRRRGFNQAEWLARWLAQALALPLVPLLRKTRNTPPQADLARELRLQNVQEAFRAKPNTYGSVWVVDDVRTTGATLFACAESLKKSGVGRVDAVTIAVTIDNVYNG